MAFFTELVNIIFMLLWSVMMLYVQASEKVAVRILFSSNLLQIINPKLNSTGHLVSVTGFAPDLLALISGRSGFEYAWNARSLNTVMDDTPTRKGLISLHLDGEGDVILGAIVPTADRFKYIDFSAPTLAAAMGMLIPYPAQTSNSKAFSQPFEVSVWMGLVTTLVIISLLWYGVDAAKTYFTKRSKACEKNAAKIFNSYKPAEYIIKVWLNQGDSLSTQTSFPIYFIAGVCCLSASIMVQAYNCNLLPLIMAPLHKPLIQSVFDIANVPGLKVAVSRGLAIDVTFQDVVKENTNTSYSKAVTALQKTIYRCNKTEDCLQRVLSNNHVYIHGDFALYHTILQNFILSGECKFTLAKEVLYRGHLMWGLPKNNPFIRNIFNIGLLETDQFGFNSYLQNRYIKKPTNCLNLDVAKVQKRPLGLDVLYIAFILLACGCGMGVIAFAIECLAHFASKC